LRRRLDENDLKEYEAIEDGGPKRYANGSFLRRSSTARVTRWVEEEEEGTLP
jgi:hypothetical protein